MLRHVNQRGSESLRVGSWCGAVLECVGSTSYVMLLYIYIFPVLFVSTIRLLDSKHFLLPFLGARFPLEVAVGMNGRVWINAKEIKQTIAMARCIEAVDPDGGGMDEAGMKALLETLDV
jgi:exosome complex RNA-binding protein Rrp4